MTSSQSQKLGVACHFFFFKLACAIDWTSSVDVFLNTWFLFFSYYLLKWLLPEIFLGWYLSNFAYMESLKIQHMLKKDKNGNFSKLKIGVRFAMFPNEILKTNWIFWILVDIAKKICYHVSCVMSPSGGGGINSHWKLSFFQKVMKKYQFWGLPNYLKVMH